MNTIKTRGRISMDGCEIVWSKRSYGWFFKIFQGVILIAERDCGMSSYEYALNDCKNFIAKHNKFTEEFNVPVMAITPRRKRRRETK